VSLTQHHSPMDSKTSTREYNTCSLYQPMTKAVQQHFNKAVKYKRQKVGP